jgi:alpha-tubulin suppressor-like RCC1 family protein
MNHIQLWSLLSALALAIGVAHVQGADFAAWGNNSSGQLGDNSGVDQPTPVQVFFGPALDINAITGGASSGYALLDDGTVWAWGNNGYGQLGDGSGVDQPKPVRVSGLTNITAIAAGYESAYALRSNGTVWAWGKNWRGELGDNSGVDQPKPVRVSGLTNIIAIAAGDMSAYALRSNGTVWAWGDNGDGQLGDNSGLPEQPTPVRVSGLTTVTAIAAGGASAYALLNNGTVWAWGDNGDGQLGDNSGLPSQPTPVQVSGLTTVTAIAAGETSGYALLSNGTVGAWGDNTFGQLGDNSGLSSQPTPVQVSGLTNITAIAAGHSSAYALRSNGTVGAWGIDNDGELGNNSALSSQPTPVQVSGLTNIIVIGAGGQAGYAVR